VDDQGAGAGPGASAPGAVVMRDDTFRCGRRTADRTTRSQDPPPASTRRGARGLPGNRGSTGAAAGRWRGVLRRPSGRREHRAAREQGRPTPWASVAEKGHRVRGGASRQGREKRRRRTEAGMEARDEARRGRPGAIRSVAVDGRWRQRASIGPRREVDPPD